ncbi:Trypsin [Popillia japonica]|uniref:Trypsin n=1 Tax=Popillia japonica TaxID=7064 RepID=A0AAW1HWU9_POPJA
MYLLKTLFLHEDEYSMNSRFCDNLVRIVKLKKHRLQYACAATLLNQTHVLTAAHCVISNSTYYVRYKSGNISSMPTYDYYVRYKSGNISVPTYDYNEVLFTDKWIHPNYNENILGCKGNDVAILKIKTSISHALPTILATSQFNYSTAFICKWNRKQTENATQLSNPEFIPVTVHDTATCKRSTC